jgi:hypothetical protein
MTCIIPYALLYFALISATGHLLPVPVESKRIMTGISLRLDYSTTWDRTTLYKSETEIEI